MIVSRDSASRAPRLRIGPVVFDPETGELRGNGVASRLPPQPARVLALLARRAGAIVTREELRRLLWGDDTFVDFEQGLNFCVRRIRSALGDEAERPAYIETLPRRGYRLIAPVEEVAATGMPPGRAMLAVLPFENIGGDPDQEYFSDGLTEELITQLGRLDPLRLGVIARTSAMAYKRTRKSVDEIGRELGVHYVLEGSVRSAGGRIRIAAQLVQVRDQTHLWAEAYERHLADLLSVQAELACAVAREIGVLLAPPGPDGRRRGAIDPTAYQAYLRGRYCWNKRTGESSRRGIGYFQDALRIDPGYARAHAGLADCWALLGDVGIAAVRPREAFARAEEAVRRAIEIDDTLAEAHASFAHVRVHAFDWAGAERAFERALALDPNYATARHWYAMYLAAMGRGDEAMAMIRRAQELDPVSLAIGTDVGVLLYYARRFDEAIAQYLRVLEMDPGFARAHATLGSAYAQKGMHEQALAALRQAMALGRDNAKKAALARACAAAGRRAEALEILTELTETPDGSYVAPFPVAHIHQALGDADEAFQWLSRAREERAPQIVFLKVDPWLDGLRPDPRFRDLLGSVGLG
jgi:TolB-like protein/Tfp pilus assembly protein PilF